MKIYLQSILNELKQYSKSLDKESMIINKPWALIDSNMGIQKLIFRKNGELILSQDGLIQDGSWDYLAEAKCVVINRGVDKLLLNELYFDDTVLILKVDGNSNSYFVLANENKLPDLDAYSYLEKLYCQKNNLLQVPLENDGYLYIKVDEDRFFGVGSDVNYNLKSISSGDYLIKEENKKISVADSKIQAIYHINKYQIEGGNCIEIEQNDKDIICSGEKVQLNGNNIESGIFLINEKQLRIHVSNSIITKIIYLKKHITNKALEILIEQQNENEYSIGDKVLFENKLTPDAKYAFKGESRFFYTEDGVIVKIDDNNTRAALLFLLIVILIVVLVNQFQK